jgi:hypothetical protein
MLRGTRRWRDGVRVDSQAGQQRPHAHHVTGRYSGTDDHGIPDNSNAGDHGNASYDRGTDRWCRVLINVAL